MNNQNIENNLYFQTQKKLSNQCGIHALNNMMGSNVFNCEQLNIICKQLSDDIINPHKHIFGGDYDVNILMVALQSKGYQCTWIDSRKKSEINTQFLNSKQVTGYLINKKSINNNVFKKILRFSGRHWISIRKINDQYHLLDSKRQKPQKIAIEIELGSHIIEVIKAN